MGIGPFGVTLKGLGVNPRVRPSPKGEIWLHKNLSPGPKGSHSALRALGVGPFFVTIFAPRIQGSALGGIGANAHLGRA